MPCYKITAKAFLAIIPQQMKKYFFLSNVNDRDPEERT